MIAGVGTDLLKIERVSKMLEEENGHFFKLFTEKEHELSKKYKKKDVYYAERFACKEAVFKCFGIAMDTSLLSQIETLNDKSGKPYVTLYGKMKAHAKRRWIRRLDISLSYDGEYVSAYAVASRFWF